MSKVQIIAFTGGYRFLSNYCACPVTIDGLTYQSAEAAFQAAKCSDPIDRAAFCTIPPNVATTAILRARASVLSRYRQAHLIICAPARLSVWPTL